MNETVSAKVVEFIRMMLPESPRLLQEIAEECQEGFIPLVTPETAQFLKVLIQHKKPSRILEIGTGIGYSAILLALANPQAKVTTIEIDEDRHERALQNFKRAGIDQRITALRGDASEVLPKLKGSFDFIFMDAAKGQYPEFFARVWPLLESGGLLVIDNIFLGGWVIDMTWPKRRKKTMVCRVRELLEMLKHHPGLTTSIVPLGDGLTVSVRRKSDEES